MDCVCLQLVKPNNFCKSNKRFVLTYSDFFNQFFLLLEFNILVLVNNLGTRFTRRISLLIVTEFTSKFIQYISKCI